MESKQKSIFMLRHRSILLYSGITIFLLLVTILLSSLEIATWLEDQLIDLRFLIRGERKPNKNVILVVIDEATKKSLGQAPYSHEYFAIVAHGLQVLGAKVVGFDYRFKNYQHPFADSPLTNVPKDYSNLVYGCYFNSIDQERDENFPGYLNQKIRKFALPIQCNNFYHATDVNLPENDLLENTRYLGHLNVVLDISETQAQKVPLFLAYEGNAYPAFCIEIIRRFFNISREQVKYFSDKIALEIPQFLPLELPISKKGEIYINHLGDEHVFPDQYSFIKILQESKEIIKTGFHSNESSIFKDKIVLLGSVLDDNHFITPFSDKVPEVLLHASLVSNMLNRNFVKSASELFNLIISLIIGSLIIYMLIKWNTQSFLFGNLGILLLYNGIAIFLFMHDGYILKMILPNIFMLLSILSLTFLKKRKSTEILAHRKETLSKQSLQLKKIERALTKPDLSKPYYKIIVPLIKLRDECILTHTLESEKDRTRGLVAFETGPQTKHPHLFSLNKLNKLSHDIEQLWKIYNLFTRENKRIPTKPIDLLKKIGLRINAEFGLSATFDNIFKFATPGTYLNFVINDLTIPWHWAYYSHQDKFLCDQFPASLSFAIEKATFGSHKTEEIPSELSDNKGAVLLYGNWKGHPIKELHCVDSEINIIKKRIERAKNTDVNSSQDVDKFLSILDSYHQNNTNLRIIHYSGHIEGDRIDVSETQYLRAGTLKLSRNFYFHSHPIVFLNGCNSGNLGYLWDKYDDLATEFLACGAAACIITHFDIVETTASKFSIQFYKNFISHKMTVGEALRQTRIDLSKTIPGKPYDPDYDITRYFYNLYGDPTVSF